MNASAQSPSTMPAFGLALTSLAAALVAVESARRALEEHALAAYLGDASWCGLAMAPGEQVWFGHCPACWIAAGAATTAFAAAFAARRAQRAD